MKRLIACCSLALLYCCAAAQDAWKISTTNIDAKNYYGITVANGQIGIVSSPEVFKVKDVVLAGAYDLYGRGRVSNFLRSFNLLNMTLDIDGKTMDAKNTSNFSQQLDMQHAAFTASFDYGDKASVTYTYYSLRHLPFTVLKDSPKLAEAHSLRGDLLLAKNRTDEAITAYEAVIDGKPTEIAAYQPPEMFVDQQLKGPYRTWIHTHQFRQDRGGTLLLDHVEFDMLGAALVSPLIKRDLLKIFTYRHEALLAHFRQPTPWAPANIRFE